MKHTSGGAYDPKDRYIYFVAGAPAFLEKHAGHNPDLLVALNELEGKNEQDAFDRLLDSGKRIFLDSGVFNLTNQHAMRNDMSMDQALALAPDEIDGFDRLWNNYCGTVTKYEDRLWGFIELDQGGATNKRVTRARIEKETGLTPIPVYHPLVDGEAYLDELAQEYDRICLGNVVQATPPARLRILAMAYERTRKYPDLWVHVLGLTPNDTMLSVSPSGSCDSSSWAGAARWGHAPVTATLKTAGRLGDAYTPPLTDPATRGQNAANPIYGKSLQMGATSAHFRTRVWKRWMADTKAAGVR